MKNHMLYGRLLNIAVLGTVLTMAGCASKPTTQHTRSVVNVPEFYTVKPGDSLSSIAQRYQLNYMDIARLNHIQHIDKIFVNQTLRLKPNGQASSTVKTQPIDTSGEIKRETLAPTQITSSTGVNVVQPQLSTAKNVTSQVGLSQQSIAVPQVNASISSSTQAATWYKPSTGLVIRHFDLSKDQKGVVFGGKIGDPVYAARQGEVVYADNGLKEFGNLVLLRHTQGYITAYAHNSKLLVKTGDQVSAGQKIAEMGDTGAQQVGLQFQVRLDGKPIDPASLISFN